MALGCSKWTPLAASRSRANSMELVAFKAATFPSWFVTATPPRADSDKFGFAGLAGSFRNESASRRVGLSWSNRAARFELVPSLLLLFV